MVSAGFGVEADGGARREPVHQIEDRLEQQQPLRRLAQPGTDHDAIVAARAEGSRRHRFGRIAEVDKTAFDIVAKHPQALDLRVDVAARELERELRHDGQIDEGGVEPDRQHGWFRHGRGSLTHCDSANMPALCVEIAKPFSGPRDPARRVPRPRRAA
ncbi:hypothetical protein ACVWW1_005898 [Bradyrhizobium sp. JR3.5]